MVIALSGGVNLQLDASLFKADSRQGDFRNDIGVLGESRPLFGRRTPKMSCAC
jgi:hypothetical protein